MVFEKSRTCCVNQLAIGDVDEAGNVFLSGYGLDIDDSYLEVEKQAQLEVLRKRRAIYAGAWSDRHHDRIVIVVDDRIAWDSSLRIFHTGKSKALNSVAPF